ncbi:MAG: endonuclease NucS domain-containing protein [Christensenellales bacterium]|jgi:tetratricopeptide (TPR) repeat protein
MGFINDIINNPHMTNAEKIEKCMDYLQLNKNDQSGYHHFANELLLSFSGGKFRLLPLKEYRSIEEFLSLEILLRDPSWENKDIFVAFYELINDNKQGVQDRLTRYLTMISEENGELFNCDSFVGTFLTPFKNAYRGFWNWLGGKLDELKLAEEGISELCFSIELFYYSENSDEIIESLLPFLRSYPKLNVVKELLGYTYYEQKMWKNAIAYYEMVYHDDKSAGIEFYDWIAFKLAWSYSSEKNHDQAARYYEEVLKIFPKAPYAKNNLGLSFLELKKYEKALEIFDECISENIDTPYCYNNKVRTLLASGRETEALAFAKANQQRGKVGKSILQRAENAVKRKSQNLHIDETEINQSVPEREKTVADVKKYRFSSERILEDELVQRLNNHGQVFGLDLHIYDKPGDFYGRQYPIHKGRIDLLTVDKKGDFHIIELKKDDGYGDVYQQMRTYMKWVKKHKAQKDQNVYGIICLNNPKKDLIRQVQREPDIRLFEYSIAYREVK